MSFAKGIATHFKLRASGIEQGSSYLHLRARLAAFCACGTPLTGLRSEHSRLGANSQKQLYSAALARMALDAPAAEAAKLDHRKATFFSIRFDILLVRLWRRRTADTDTMRSEER